MVAEGFWWRRLTGATIWALNMYKERNEHKNNGIGFLLGFMDCLQRIRENLRMINRLLKKLYNPESFVGRTFKEAHIS